MYARNLFLFESLNNAIIYATMEFRFGLFCDKNAYIDSDHGCAFCSAPSQIR